jgi:hypothetical protein
MSLTSDEAGGQVSAIGEAAEALWDGARRMQDLLDELEQARLGRWEAYAAFRDVGALFRFALERLRMERPLPELAEVIETYRGGARLAFEAAADLAFAMREGGAQEIELGVQRLALASQQFVRGRYLLQRYLDEASGGSPDTGDQATNP